MAGGSTGMYEGENVRMSEGGKVVVVRADEA